MNTSDDQVLRVKRIPPERGGPIRSVSMAFRAPEQDNGHQPGQNFIASAVNSAYRVIDDYLKQGEEAARMRQQSLHESAGHPSTHPNPHDPSHQTHHSHPHHPGGMGPDISAIAWQSWSKMAQSWVEWAMRAVGQGMPMPWMSPFGGNGQQYGFGQTPPWGGFSWMNAPWMAMQWWWSIMSWWTQIMRMPYALGPQPPPWGGVGGPYGYPHQPPGPHGQAHFGPQQEPSWPPFWPTNPSSPPAQNHHDPKQTPQAAPTWPQSGPTGHAPPMNGAQNETPFGSIRPSANPTRPTATRIDPIIRIMAALPTDVHVDLPDPFMATRTYAVAKFEANDSNANLPAHAIAFHHEDGSLVVAVTIHAHQQAAKYTAKIIDKDTGVAYGNIRITVRPAPTTTQGVS